MRLIALTRLLRTGACEGCRIVTFVSAALSMGCGNRDVQSDVGHTTATQIQLPQEPAQEASGAALLANADKARLTMREEPSPHPWQRILTLDRMEPDALITSLWVSDQHTVYITGNRGVMRQALNGAVQREAIGTDDFMLDVWGTSDADVYAVGGRGAVVHYDGLRWMVERRPGPAVRRSAELLSSVVFVAAYQTVVALGPGLSLKRLPTGAWVALSAEENGYVRARWGGNGREPEPCLGAGLQAWAADRAGKEWVLCHDRRTYWLEHDVFVPHGSAPPECHLVFRHVFFHGALYATCNGALFRNVDTDWQREPIVENVESLSATERCLFAAGRRAVFRTCI